MALEQQVKRYLAYWFQLGKKVFLGNGQEELLPEPVFDGDRYSPAFESCWNRILAPESGDCYLEATEQTIKELLSPGWQIASCARCNMPVPRRELGQQSLLCPCHDLPSWPNTELPTPRLSANSAAYLRQIQERLQQKHDYKL